MFLKMIFKSKLHKIIFHMCDTTVHTFKFPVKPKRKLGTGAGVLSPAICEAKDKRVTWASKRWRAVWRVSWTRSENNKGNTKSPTYPWSTLCLLVPSFFHFSCLHSLLHFSCIHTVGCWISQDFSWVQQNPWLQRPQEEGIPFTPRFQAIVVGSLWQPGSGLEECLHWLPRWVCPFHPVQLPSLWEWTTSIRPLPEVGFSVTQPSPDQSSDDQN